MFRKAYPKESLAPVQDLSLAKSATIELNNFQELKKIFKWKLNPVTERDYIFTFEYLEDANERKVRDAESLGTVMRNVSPNKALEIGTAYGNGTLILHDNCPKSTIYTLNIDPEEIYAGEGGEATTIAIEREKIGEIYKAAGAKNIHQIFANTATWKPDIAQLEFAFIDGCHDTDFVYNDTKKILPLMVPGGFILWHDYNLQLTSNFPWIKDVCTAIDMLIADGLLVGRIYHIKDSWVGIYQVPAK